MGDPCMDQEIVLVIESPFTRRPPGLSPFLLTGLHRNTCCSARLLYVRNEAVVFVIAVRVLPPAIYKMSKKHIITHYYIFLPVKNALARRKSNFLAQRLLWRGAIVREIAAKMILHSNKELGKNHDLLRICK
jgi:hypothetical protein